MTLSCDSHHMAMREKHKVLFGIIACATLSYLGFLACTLSYLGLWLAKHCPIWDYGLRNITCRSTFLLPSHDPYSARPNWWRSQNLRFTYLVFARRAAPPDILARLDYLPRHQSCYVRRIACTTEPLSRFTRVLHLSGKPVSHGSSLTLGHSDYQIWLARSTNIYK